jgi:hypothetical protein
MTTPTFITPAKLPFDRERDGEIHYLVPTDTFVVRPADQYVLASPGQHVVGRRTRSSFTMEVFDPAECPVCQDLGLGAHAPTIAGDPEWAADFDDFIDGAPVPAGGVHFRAPARTACGQAPSPARPVVDADPRNVTCPDCLTAMGVHPSSTRRFTRSQTS